MLRRSAVVCVVQLVLAVTVAVAQEAPVTQCDTYAGSRVAGDNLEHFPVALNQGDSQVLSLRRV